MPDTEPSGIPVFDIGTSPEVKRIPGKYIPMGAIIVDCITAGVISSENIQTRLGTPLNEGLVLPVIDRHLPSAWGQLEFSNFKTPSEEDVRDGYRQGLLLLYRHGLVDLKIFQDASKIAGVGNLKVIRDSRDSWLIPTADYIGEGRLGWGNRRHWNRERFFRQEIGLLGINPLAKKYYDACDSAGKPVAVDQATKMATVAVGTHEFSHAVDRAFRANGIDTERCARNLHFEDINLIEFKGNPFSIHGELFARGIHEMVVGDYLATFCGYGREQVTSFNRAILNSHSTEITDARKLIKYALDNGIRLITVGDIEVAIYQLVKKNYGEEYHYNNLDWIRAYRYPAYTEEQLALLVKK